MELRYSFPFYRSPIRICAGQARPGPGLGLVMQDPHASIKFIPLDYDDATQDEAYVSQNVGLVPALAIYSSYEFPFGLRLSADIAGSYASSEFFNGADFEFEGSILDASLRAGYVMDNNWELFGNLRFFGGSAKGTSDPESSWSVSSYNYTENYIAALTVSVGAVWSM